jgi:hypothetical protein
VGISYDWLMQIHDLWILRISLREIVMRGEVLEGSKNNKKEKKVSLKFNKIRYENVFFLLHLFLWHA